MTHLTRFATLAAAVIGVAVPVAPVAAQADTRPAVAVLPFDNVVASPDARQFDGLRSTIAEALVVAVASRPGVRVVDRDRLQQLLGQEQLLAGPLDRATAIRLGKLLGAQHVIFGGFVADAKGNLRIDARAVEVEQGMLERTERIQGKSGDLRALAATLAASLMAAMHLSIRAAEQAPTG